MVNCNECGKELKLQYKPIRYVKKFPTLEFTPYCKDCILKIKVRNEVIAQKFGFVINRIAQNDYKIIKFNKIRKSEGIQLVIDYLYNENKNLLKLIA